jgi:hypothetical protein
VIALGAAIYRSLLRLYPHAFRRAFQDELEYDFDDGSRDAVAVGGRPALVKHWARAARDLAVSLCREWLKTPWIPVLVVAATVSLSLFGYAAFQMRRWPQHAYWPAWRAPDAPADSLELLVLMAVGVLIPIAGTILGSLWMLLLRRSASGRSRRRV